MEIEPLPASRVFRLAVALEGGLALVSLGLSWLLGISLGDWWRADFTRLATALAACLPLLGFMVFAIRTGWQPLRNFRMLVEEHLVPLFAACNVLQMAVISLLAGVGEELLFRGLIQGGLQSLLGPWWACAVASVTFGLAHALSAAYVVFAILIGVYLGCLWLATESLTVPIATHALYDFLALLYLVGIRRKPPHAPGDDADDAICTGLGSPK